MKIYVWLHLFDGGYGIGVGFAMAESVDQARELIKTHPDQAWRFDESQYGTDSPYLAALNQAPDLELDSPYGMAVLYME